MDRLSDIERWVLAAPIYLAAYVTAGLVFWWMAHRRGMPRDAARNILLAGLVGGLVGANLVQLIATGLPGKTIEGGIAGGWLAVLWMKRQTGYAFPTGDCFALAIPAGEAIGRIGCFIGGCCYGKVSTVAWALHDHGALRHPTQLYLSAAAATSFALLLILERRAKLSNGMLFYAAIVVFALSRFSVDFFREAPAIAYGLTTSQLACLAAIVAIGLRLAYRRVRERRFTLLTVRA